ncbi:glycosyltransferase [Pseudoxanthomonas sp. CF125]|uniref:glycosyltransferase n=1 Tax=Pseudoxanthomonas sp. CF125 TaxID=1855303 RepID=UPI0008921B8A|nr:glycosyltransferase [Pseudoxanthomonas sp. CF125]SDQ92871.1 beta-1,4-mannosyltransferase&\
MNVAHTPWVSATPARRFVVLQSTGKPDETTNPYLVQLLDALPENVEVRYFSVRDALFSRYDLFHVHWPEYLLRHRTPLTTLAKRACMFLLLLRLWLTRVPVVRTLHNLRPHEQGGMAERLLLRWLDHLTTRKIRINAAERDADPTTDTILHGHYRDWFAARQVPPSIKGRLLCFGLIRPYKGVETLIEAFRGLPDASATLRIVGRPVGAAMRQVVEDACAADARTGAILEYVGDEVLAKEIGEAQCVVLPYRDMQNSGALLLALSLARPVLVPRSDANVALAAEVGEEWVRLYDGALDADILTATLRALGEPQRQSAPDLSRREWPRLGMQHHATYVAALDATEGRGR